MAAEVGKIGKTHEGTGDALILAGLQSTLVKYDTPCLVSTHERKKAKLESAAKFMSQISSVLPIPGHCVSDVERSKKETEEILNTIIPPKTWNDESGNLWKQTVSTVPATRQDVIALEEQLNLKLKQMQARETGICPIRRELYAQCFEELIRQVTINCAERGILLLRVRDEINMTLEAYQSLYESSTAYGMRKALMAESGKSDLEAAIGTMVVEKDSLEASVSELQLKLEEIEKRYNDQRSREEARHDEDIAALKKANSQLKQQLEAIVLPKKG